MRKRLDLSSGWTSYEVIRKDEARTTPFSDVLATSGELPVGAFNKMSILEEVGWPEALRRMRYSRKGRPRIVKKDDVIWLLKCTPDCWRLYFYVIPTPYRYIVYVHAIAKGKMPKTQVTPSPPETFMTTSKPVEVLSRPSSSRLDAVYRNPDFQLAWDNQVRLHIAKNVLKLRRFRQMSQAKVAAEMGTSQSALARIESGQENLTADTLERLIGALNGRFHVSIAPAELPARRWTWWETLVSTSKPWHLRWAALKQDAAGRHVVLGLTQPHTFPPAGTLPSADLLVSAVAK